MAKSIIAYDKDLPQIPGRCPWEEPTSFLVKDAAAPNGRREDTSGRRPSRLLLIQKLRAKDQHGMYFPWTVCDNPLAQVVEDRIVKAPLIVTNEDDAKQPMQDPDHITGENICGKYSYWLYAAVQRWQEHSQTFRPLGTQPVLFIMAGKNAYARYIGGL